MQRFCAQDPKPHPMTLNQANQGFGGFLRSGKKNANSNYKKRTCEGEFEFQK